MRNRTNDMLPRNYDAQMASISNVQRRIANEGYVARCKGVLASANPYDGWMRASAWFEGWVEADTEIKAKG